MRPRLLDLFCGAGGAAMGYHRAGFDVVGVDIRPQPNYPFEFVQADAIEAVAHWIVPPFDAIHASPPCQAYSVLRHAPNVRDHPELIEPTRDVLRASGLPYVIENVPGAPMLQAAVICGRATGHGSQGFGLRRHRLFETNWPLMVPPCACDGSPTIGIYGDKARDRRRGKDMSRSFKREPAMEAMGIDWMTWPELCQAIPPIYTELIGHQLMQHLRAAAA